MGFLSKKEKAMMRKMKNLKKKLTHTRESRERRAMGNADLEHYTNALLRRIEAKNADIGAANDTIRRRRKAHNDLEADRDHYKGIVDTAHGQRDAAVDAAADAKRAMDQQQAELNDAFAARDQAVKTASTATRAMEDAQAGMIQMRNERDSALKALGLAHNRDSERMRIKYWAQRTVSAVRTEAEQRLTAAQQELDRLRRRADNTRRGCDSKVGTLRSYVARVEEELHNTKGELKHLAAIVYKPKQPAAALLGRFIENAEKVITEIKASTETNMFEQDPGKGERPLVVGSGETIRWKIIRCQVDEPVEKRKKIICQCHVSCHASQQNLTRVPAKLVARQHLSLSLALCQDATIRRKGRRCLSRRNRRTSSANRRAQRRACL